MRVLLSGTSNCILEKSIKYSFENDRRVTSFTNASYGASGSVAIGDHLRNIDFSNYDFCVLDYCVNEGVFISQKKSTTELAIGNLSAIIDAASRAGCQPIIMIFPTSTRENLRMPFEAEIINRFQSVGVPVFNFYALAKQLTATGQLKFLDLFADPMHVRNELGQFLGKTAIDYMQSVEGTQTKHRAKISSYHYRPLSFVQFQHFNIHGESRVLQRATKLRSTELMWIAPGSKIEFTASGPAEIIGLTFNAARSCGTLRASQSDEISSDMRGSVLFSEKRVLTLVSHPFQKPLIFDSGLVSLHFESPDELKVGQPIAGLEIFGFILRSLEQEIPLHVLTSSDEIIKLEDRVLAGDIDDLLRTLVEVIRPKFFGL